MQHINDDDNDNDVDLENNDAKIYKKTFLHPAGSPIITSSLSLLQLKIMMFIKNKMLEVLLGQEAVRNNFCPNTDTMYFGLKVFIWAINR